MKLNAQQLREVDPENIIGAINKVQRNDIYLLLENVYDTYNIGGLFRLADALAVKTLYLCGDMETPPNGRILKASIGTYKVVPWIYHKTAKDALEELRKNEPKVQVVAVEQDATSKPYTEIEYKPPVCIIVGNETYGVLPETLALADSIAEIPMWGINKSLNVIVSAAIASYYIIGKLKK
jgi:tRNA G18 (ribose-2'-O)-methylase SpoU